MNAIFLLQWLLKPPKGLLAFETVQCLSLQSKTISALSPSALLHFHLSDFVSYLFAMLFDIIKNQDVSLHLISFGQ